MKIFIVALTLLANIGIVAGAAARLVQSHTPTRIVPCDRDGSVMRSIDVMTLNDDDKGYVAIRLGATYDPFCFEEYFETETARKGDLIDVITSVITDKSSEEQDEMLRSGIIFNAHPIHKDAYDAFFAVMKAQEHANPNILKFVAKLESLLPTVTTNHTLLFFTPLIMIKLVTFSDGVEDVVGYEYCYQNNMVFGLKAQNIFIKYFYKEGETLKESFGVLFPSTAPNYSDRLKSFFHDRGIEAWTEL